MGLTNAGLNFMYFIFVLNLAIAITAAAYPQFSYVDTGQYPQLNESIQKVENINPDSIGTWGAYDVARTFLGNVLSGNYYLWRGLGLDETWSTALAALAGLSYLIVLIAVIWGRVL